MKTLILFAGLLAVCAASVLPPVLVPKVNVGPAQVTVVKNPITIQEPELIIRKVPVPIKAIQYNPPVVRQSAPIINAPIIAGGYAAVHPYANLGYAGVGLPW